MSKERRYKKELKSIERLLRKNHEQRTINEWDSNSVREDVFYVLDNCEKAKNIIDNSKVKEGHVRPHAYLAMHDGFYARGLPEGVYRDNLDIVQKIAMNHFFDLFTKYAPNGSLEGTINAVLNIKDSSTNKTLRERLEELDITSKDIADKFEWAITQNANIAIKSLDAMEDLKSKGSYAFDLLKTFDDAMTRYKLLKDRSPDAFKFQIQGRELSNDELYSKALDYAFHSLNIIKTFFKTYPMNSPEALQPLLFSDYGIESYGFLKDFIERHGKIYVGLKKDYDIIEKEMENFAAFISKRQQDMLDTASKVAKEGNSSYRIYLNKFRELTEKYSYILEEEDLEIARMQRILDPERHIGANSKNDANIYGFNGTVTDINSNKRSLPLYRVYKNLNGSTSLPKIVLDIKKDYVKAKREERR